MANGEGRWSLKEKAILTEYWSSGGPLVCRRNGLMRSQAAMRCQACVLGLKQHKSRRKAKQEPAWGRPTMDLCDRLACIQLRKWRYPVSPGLVGGRIGL